MMKISVSTLQIPFNLTMTHASATRSETAAIWVSVERGAHRGLGESCPRDYVTGETLEGALTWLAGQRDELSRLRGIEDLSAYVREHTDSLDAHPAAFCAVELALLDLFARERGCSVEALLGVSEERAIFPCTAVVFQGSEHVVRAMVARYLKFGFRDFKLKLSGVLEADVAMLTVVRELTAGMEVTVRLDGNNVFGQDAERARAHVSQLPGRVEMLEEPLAPRQIVDSGALSRTLGVRIGLDESLVRPADVDLYRDVPGDWSAVIKVSKAGGLLRTLSLIEAVSRTGWPIFISCQVGETSLLTRAGVVAARAAGEHLRSTEIGYTGVLLAHDPVRPSLSVGPGGVLDLRAAALGPHGFGVEEHP